jgi:hypothetical protein
MNAIKVFIWTILVLAFLGLVTGCSVTTLRCGIDGDSSFVDLTSAPQDISANSRNYAQLCGFAYEVEEPET